ncbi:hypothetical protein BFJ65_g18323 [Fusarium oxysporum f. sp. cepae]|uniref:HAT C-terminal dimerisation domain-containing protein n=1 Tax=Fusarium oxysporum f. sp. cepae TaxID=396571 RepID=A0A3L6MRF9_FUSOX|nr:hypothetical protein BFJ65_g18323 [Fusarium oxysporum f. sp. cepae]
MSAEPERLFSGAKITITDRLNRLGSDVVEALECLKSWFGMQELQDATLELEGHAIHGNYGALWQALEMMDILDGLLQEEKAAVAADPRSYSNYYVAGLDAGYTKLMKYFDLTAKTPYYRAAICLVPSFKLLYFKDKWRSHEIWVDTVEPDVRQLYNEYATKYSITEPASPPQQTEQPQQTPELGRFKLHRRLDRSVDVDSNSDRRKRRRMVDEFERYLYDEDVVEPFVEEPLTWWREREKSYPILTQMAFDLFSIPAMSAECERVFSQSKRLITDERNRLGSATIEANECLKNWLRRGHEQRRLRDMLAG